MAAVTGLELVLLLVYVVGFVVTFVAASRWIESERTSDSDRGEGAAAAVLAALLWPVLIAIALIAGGILRAYDAATREIDR